VPEEGRERRSAESAVRRDTFLGAVASPLRLKSEQGRPHVTSSFRRLLFFATADCQLACDVAAPR
jgi:hypothetical protein